MAKKKKPIRRRKKISARSVGLEASETAVVDDARVRALAADITADGGAVLGDATASRSAARRCSSSRCRSTASSRRRISAIRRSRTSSG